jgi:pyridoxamine 5'-phosphate oxidase
LLKDALKAVNPVDATVDKLIPRSPSEAEYRRQLEANSAEEIFDAADPFALFGQWLAAAREREPNDPNAFALATADAGGRPDVRMVLLKGFDARGFVFYTNLGSAKGDQLAANPQAAMLFHWKSLRRQVRVRGAATSVTAQEADAYFAERARDARVGAIASDQSRPLESREALEARIAALEAELDGRDPDRPEHWSGFRITPAAFEFWRDRPFRLHDRLLLERDGEGWRRTRLYP